MTDDRKIRDKYGGKLAKAINRAIRAEMPGGNEALDTLTKLAGAARQSNWKDERGRHTAEAVAYFRHMRDVVAPLEAQVRRKYGVKAAEINEHERDVPTKPRRKTSRKK